ncbi:23S rRNA (adenine(2503)-C(2))-methyltransferase RlmN [bacterium]|nr:23S rRNA (adenine(2503)-C(2))-methyltransferase RlmN [bacterium]
MMSKTNLKSLTFNELQEWIHSTGEKPFRASQIWSWLYQKNIVEFSGMTNIARSFQTHLHDHAFIYSLSPVKTTGSSATRTQKILWQLEDGLHIESVFIPDGHRRTFCISTQAGCAMGCGFCATAAMGFQRNLHVHEMTEQVLSMQRHLGIKPTNLVLMGMGEPFLNYDNVIRALTILNNAEGTAIGHRRITISTCGIVPAIERYTRENHPYKLAISLNATTDETRSSLMPVNRKYPLNTLLRAAEAYTRQSHKRITFEYVMIRNLNDTPEDARRLMRMLRGIPCKVNLIGYNATNPDFTRSDDKRIHAFAEAIAPLSAPVTLRLSKGDDIQAACGQLATKQESATELSPSA